MEDGRFVTSGSGGSRRPFVADAAFERLKELIIGRTGHFYYQDKDELLWERLGRRLHATGLRDTAAYLERLSDPVEGEAEWIALEAEITIGETFFFRYAEQFAALRDTVLPAIIEAKRESPRIRIWSAGCATGAEPYSVAILLRQVLGEETDHWRITILATDLNQTFLAAARRGQFGDWALRTIPVAERERDFTPVEGGRSWILKSQHRAMVRFERHNLRSLLNGTSPLEMSDFDLILCRNVLIYFHPDTATRIVRALSERLSEGGWLLVGHAEPSPAFRQFLTAVDLPGTVAFRQPPPPEPDDPPRAPAADARQTPPPPVPPGKDGLPQSRPRPAPAPLPPRPSTVPEAAPREDVPAGIDDVLAEVRSLANLGDLQRARRACSLGLQTDPTNAALHYYDGLVARALGDAVGAERAFRRVIYLQGNFIMGHYQLGLLLIEAGRGAAGRRAVANALRIALSLPDHAVLEEGDGLTAATFRAIARLHLTPPSGSR